MGIDELQELMNHWKCILNLHRWEIVIIFDSEMAAQGNVEYCEDNCTALIRIKDPSSWDIEHFKQRIEKSIIHELLHLKFGLFEPKGELQYRIFHQELNDMACILEKLSIINDDI